MLGARVHLEGEVMELDARDFIKLRMLIHARGGLKLSQVDLITTPKSFFNE